MMVRDRDTWHNKIFTTWYVGMYCDIYPQQNSDTFSSKINKYLNTKYLILKLF
jgi:hypothetical protein